MPVGDGEHGLAGKVPRGLWHELVDVPLMVRLPDGAAGNPVDFIARLESIEVTPDTPARIILNERTGTIVATADIHISRCAVSHGNITINVASTLNVSQPNAFSNKGRTVVTPSTSTDVTESKASLVPLPEMPTLEQVAAALAGSSEFFVVQGGGTNDGFLHAFYQDALGRPIDAGGLAWWNAQLAAGMSRTQLAAAILASDEYRQNLIESAYQHLLGRSADEPWRMAAIDPDGCDLVSGQASGQPGVCAPAARGPARRAARRLGYP